MLASLGEPLSLYDAAQVAGVSERTLLRRFVALLAREMPRICGISHRFCADLAPAGADFDPPIWPW
jgi:hypothetical protein